MDEIRKLWRKWSWAFHAIVWVSMGTAIVVGRNDAIAEQGKWIATQESEKLPERMAVQENSTGYIIKKLDHMDMVQGKIFERLNQITDRRVR